ncbi:MAG: glycerol-3-phosphate 1-O-acyltransferase PlsY [Synergistes sp.]|nr:glycerol-3-phosphate 1-O-acyltransferase PlsY [Synergistes sp.]
MSESLWIVFGYLVGSCPTGFLAAKFIAKKDIRTIGSGNIGATNVGRLMGKKWAVAVAVFDILKGGLSVLLASIFVSSPSVLSAVGFFAVLGHNFPVWLNFRGGKGVATTFGAIAFYNFFFPWPAIFGAAVWYTVMRKTKYVSVASLVGLASAACAMALCTVLDFMPWQYTLSSFALSVVSVIRHRQNIMRIKDGTESKVRS